MKATLEGVARWLAELFKDKEPPLGRDYQYRTFGMLMEGRKYDRHAKEWGPWVPVIFR